LTGFLKGEFFGRKKAINQKTVTGPVDGRERSFRKTLDGERLKRWLKEYSLGSLYRFGELEDMVEQENYKPVQADHIFLIRAGIFAFCATVFTRETDSIRTFITIRAVPFTPISTCAAYFTMPGAIVLYDFVPTKRIPI